MRVESDTGCLLYWPPHDGVIYSIAGPVSVAVPIIIRVVRGEVANLDFKRLATGYQIETRIKKRVDGEQSRPIPPWVLSAARAVEYGLVEEALDDN